MAAVIKYDPKDVPAFQKEVCLGDCIMKGSCIKEGYNNDWFLMCPHYHQWKLGIPDDWLQQKLKYDRAHPEECAARHQKEVEKAKAWKEQQKSEKKVTKTRKTKKKDEKDKTSNSRTSTKGRKKASA